MATAFVARRTLLKVGLKAGVGALALAAGGFPAAFAQDKRLRMYWWGGKERADRTFKVNELYSARHPGVTIDGETLGWGDYWARLATQAAGRNAPDILQMDYRYIYEYARRGALLPLDPFMSKELSIADFGKDAIDSGRVDGKLYGVSLGLNSTAVLYSRTAYENAGLKPPTHETSWAQFAELSAELTKANKGAYFGTMDGGGTETAFEVWVRQRGKSIGWHSGTTCASARRAFRPMCSRSTATATRPRCCRKARRRPPSSTRISWSATRRSTSTSSA